MTTTIGSVATLLDTLFTVNRTNVPVFFVVSTTINISTLTITTTTTSFTNRTPAGLEDVSKYPELFAELLARGWSERDIQKLAGLNLIRVFKAVEQVRETSFSYYYHL
ncbi:hypothetical protein M0802_014052 [Mischocyttarus mexicanus]|nr:hypothetical protein M0802_014052 [Mischocyttarus mexicanus]